MYRCWNIIKERAKWLGITLEGCRNDHLLLLYFLSPRQRYNFIYEIVVNIPYDDYRITKLLDRIYNGRHIGKDLLFLREGAKSAERDSKWNSFPHDAILNKWAARAVLAASRGVDSLISAEKAANYCILALGGRSKTRQIQIIYEILQEEQI